LLQNHAHHSRGFAAALGPSSNRAVKENDPRQVDELPTDTNVRNFKKRAKKKKHIGMILPTVGATKTNGSGKL
jgi:hypothetical protein